MQEQIQNVMDFMARMGQETPMIPEIPSPEISLLRWKLTHEENQEMMDGVNAKDLIEVADGIFDKIYVVLGDIIAFGFMPIAMPLFAEVHRSNLTKLCKTEQEAADTIANYRAKDAIAQVSPTYQAQQIGDSFVVIREDGKAMKSINYSPANLKPIIYGYLAQIHNT